jgi:hypothetical protein
VIIVAKHLPIASLLIIHMCHHTGKSLHQCEDFNKRF